MSEVIYGWLFWSLMGSCAAIFAWTLISVPLMFLLSGEFMQKYFRKPHFNEGEIVVLSTFPTIFIRTVMFVRLLASPSSGKVRGLAEAYKDVPKGVRRYAQVLYVVLIVALVWMFGTLSVLFSVIAYDSL